VVEDTGGGVLDVERIVVGTAAVGVGFRHGDLAQQQAEVGMDGLINQIEIVAVIGDGKVGHAVFQLLGENVDKLLLGIDMKVFNGEGGAAEGRQHGQQQDKTEQRALHGFHRDSSFTAAARRMSCGQHAGLPAATEDFSRNCSGAPASVETRPPASATIREPAA